MKRKITNLNRIEMKTPVLMLISIFIATNVNLSGNDAVKENHDVLNNSINIVNTPDLKNLTANWINEYKILNPDVQINISDYTNNNVKDLNVKSNNIYLISTIDNTVSQDNNMGKMIIGRNVIVPIINSKNPLLEEINKQGISPAEFAELVKNPGNMNWNTLLDNVQSLPLNFYTTDDELINSALKEFLNVEEINGVKRNDIYELILSIQNDPKALGFCNIVDITNINKNSIVNNILILPIDKNGNAKLDYMEEIYTNLSSFMRGVWIGKYPKKLYSNVYALYNIEALNNNETTFLKWVNTNGQQYLNTAGFSELTLNERHSNLYSLEEDRNYIAKAESAPLFPKMILFAILTVVIALVLIDLTIRYFKRNKTMVIDVDSIGTPEFGENNVLIPKGLFYDKSNTWAFMDKDGKVKIGVADFLQHVTGSITQVRMKDKGKKIEKGMPIFTIVQDGKHLYINSPISGIIVDRNETLTAKSIKINNSPYDEGWIYAVEPTNWIKEIQLLLMAEKYKNWLKDEFTRLKDFLVNTLKPNEIENSLVFQDGGTLKEGLLEDFGPEVWEDFQTNFINNAK